MADRMILKAQRDLAEKTHSKTAALAGQDEQWQNPRGWMWLKVQFSKPKW